VVEEAEIQAREFIEKARIQQDRVVTDARIANEEDFYVLAFALG